MLDFLKKNNVLIISILGSIVRLLYGYYYEPWTQAPDHTAWELIIEQSSFSYDHLIHYPHEGGTILISIFSLFIELLTDFSSLTISAFIIDFVVRFVQITIVKRVFDFRIALVFGLWTIFATPSIIPWGTLNFGLHSISSIFPFILIFILFQKQNSAKFHLFCGLFLGLSIWFSYTNIILVPVFFLYRVLNRDDIKKYALSFISLIGVLLIHLLVRQLNAGFHLNDFGFFSIRGENFSISNIDILDRLNYIPNVIANSSMALPNTNDYMYELRLAYYSLILLSLIGFILAYRKQQFNKSIYVIFSTILFFLISYLLSPFFESRDTGNYVAFRHLTYIIPLVSLLIIAGLSNFKYKILVVAFLVIGIYRTSQLFTLEKSPPNDIYTKASGWVLGTKLGHNSSALIPIIEDNPENRKSLIYGIGWGISASLMQNTSAVNNTKANLKINELYVLFSSFPDSFHEDLLEGIKFAFSDQVTPRLDAVLLLDFEKKINEMKNNY